MCFIKRVGEGEREAEEDIECWKVVDKYKGEYFSHFMSHPYQLGVLNPYIKIELGEPPIGSLLLYREGAINIGYHSYSILNKAIDDRNGGWGDYVIKCIIPKGSKYYYDPHFKEYVSTQIILVEEVNLDS